MANLVFQALEDGAPAPAPGAVPATCSLCAPAGLRWAALAGIGAAPCLLRDGPSGNPIREASIAIVGRRSGSDGGTSTRARAALPVVGAAPLLFRHRPTCLPIRKSISAIVRISWPRWQGGLHRRQEGHDGHRRRRCGRATDMVDAAAPLLFVCGPSVLRIHCAIEWVHWARGSGWRCGWWGWRRGWEWRRWRSRLGHREGRGRPSGGASPANCHAAIVLLPLGPGRFPLHEAFFAIVWR